MPAETPASRIAAAVERRFGAAFELPDELPHLDALAALNERSVCRRYRGDPVPEALVRLLCASALAAPTKSDLQQASLVRVADPSKRAAICALLPASPWLARAPELFVFCADGFRLRRLFERRGAEFPNEHLDAFFNATVDAAIALGALVCAAELLGLGTCPLSARLALSATVHTDRYDTSAVERELDAYDSRRGRDWSGDKVRQYSKVMRADFGEYVARKRFQLR